MRIENLRSEQEGAAARIVASVLWEDADFPPVELYFETDAEAADDLQLSAEPFVAACLLPALWHGEQRLRIDADICPLFLDNVKTNIDYLARWYGSRFHQPRFEFRSDAKALRAPARPSGRPPGHDAGMLLSGGVDSFFTLRRNLLMLPPDHPARIRKCILIDYHAFRRAHGGGPRRVTAHGLGQHQTHARMLESVVRSVGGSFIQVRTNLRLLEDSSRFWLDAFHGAAMSAVVHSVGRNLCSATFASADIPLMRAYGSHPLTDPNWSSQALTIRHDTMRYSRFEKTRLIADWDAGLEALRVCTSLSSDLINCGQCEKCLRTRLSLLALGKSREGPPFYKADVAPAELARLRINEPYQAKQYQNIADELEKAGRPDLANALLPKLRAYRRQESRRAGRKLVVQADESLLGGSLKKIYRWAR